MSPICFKTINHGIETSEQTKDAIIFRLDNSIANAEGYQLSVSPFETTITAKTGAGAFYAVQTMLQLMPALVYSSENKTDKITVSCVEITDDNSKIRWISWVKPGSETPNFHIPSSFGQLNLKD